MTRRPIIAIDVDDVLADHAGGFTAFSNERYGTTLAAADYDEHFGVMWGVDLEEVKRRFAEYIDAGCYRTYAPHPQALEVLRRLSTRFQLVVLTSRPVGLKEDTIDWIGRHYPGIFDEDSIYFAGIWDDIQATSIHLTKGERLRQLGAQYLIDDQVKHCNAAAEVGVTPLLFGDYRWNAELPVADSVVRVTDWHAVEGYFNGHER